MRRLANLPSRQSERYQQCENPRNPPGQFLRIRLFYNIFTRAFPIPRSRRSGNPYPSVRPARISTTKQDETPKRQIQRNDIDASRVPGVDLAGIDSRQEQERQLPPGQHRRRDEQSGGEEQEWDEIAVAVRPGDDVMG